MLQILGSRRSILFVEGDESSLDAKICRVLFPERLVIPRGSCQRVIDSTVTVNALPQMHHADAYGLIDRDRRSEKEVNSYGSHRVFAPELAEIENLFLTPEVIRAVSKSQGRDPEADFATVRLFLFCELEKGLSMQVTERAIFQIQHQLNSFAGIDGRNTDSNGFSKAVYAYLDQIAPESVYLESNCLFQALVKNSDFDGLLRNYNRKSLANRISRCLGFADHEYPKFVLRFLGFPEGLPLVNILRTRYFGRLHGAILAGTK